jgi:hypothetical protein
MRCCCRADIVRAACVNTSKAKFCNAMSPAFSIKKSWWRPSVTARSSPRAASRNTRKQRLVGRARHAVLGSRNLIEALFIHVSGTKALLSGILTKDVANVVAGLGALCRQSSQRERYGAADLGDAASRLKLSRRGVSQTIPRYLTTECGICSASIEYISDHCRNDIILIVT